MANPRKRAASDRSEAEKNKHRTPTIGSQESSTAGAQTLPAYIPYSNKERFSFLLGEDFVEKHNVAWRVELAQQDAGNPLMEPRIPLGKCRGIQPWNRHGGSHRWTLESLVHFLPANQAAILSRTKALLCRI